jgi:hypothetical protein
MRYPGASVRSWSAAIFGAACVMAHGGPAAGQSARQPSPFVEDFGSGVIDWTDGWDTNGGKDSYQSYYRVDRLSPGFLAFDRQSYYSHSIHDYFHEQVGQALLPTGEHGFWDQEDECWAGLLLWSAADGWYGATGHDWRFSVELEEGALMASIVSGTRPMDQALKSELLYMRKHIDENGALSDLSAIGGIYPGAYEYGLALSALALGVEHFEDEDIFAAQAAYEDLEKVFGGVLVRYQDRMEPCEEAAVMLRGYVNAHDAFLIRGDTVSAGTARKKMERIALDLVASQDRDGAFIIYDGKLHVQKQLKVDIGLLLAHAVTKDRRYVEAVNRNLQWIIANRWDSSPKCYGGLMWAADDLDTFFECHQMWFILAARYLETCSEFSYRPFIEDAFAFLTDDNCAGADMYEHNAETYGAFFSYRAVSRDGTIQKDPFHQWKGGYEIGASLWALAAIRDVYSAGHSRLATQPPEGSSGTWDRAIFSARDFGNGSMSFQWDVQFKDVRYAGAYTGLFNGRSNDGIFLLDTSDGLSYRDSDDRRRVLVDKARLGSGVVYTVKLNTLKPNLIQVILLADGAKLFEGFVSDMRSFDSCRFGVFQQSGGASRAKAVFVDDVRYAPLGSGLEGSVPEATAMRPGYPNPFNAGIRIDYDVSVRGPVSLRVFDAAGRLVADLAEGVTAPGRYSVFWDGRDRNGARVASGVYFCRFRAQAGNQNQKIVLLR